MKTKEIKLRGKEVVITSAPLIELVKVLDLVQKVPEKVVGLDISDETSVLFTLASLLKENSTEIFKLLSSISGVELKIIEQLDIAESMMLFRVIVEVNDVEAIKKEWGELKQVFNKKEVGSTK